MRVTKIFKRFHFLSSLSTGSRENITLVSKRCLHTKTESKVFESVYDTKIPHERGKLIALRITAHSLSPSFSLLQPQKQPNLAFPLSLSEASWSVLDYLKPMNPLFVFARTNEVVLFFRPPVPFLGFRVQKLTSISSSIFTTNFHSSFLRRTHNPTTHDKIDFAKLSSLQPLIHDNYNNLNTQNIHSDNFEEQKVESLFFSCKIFDIPQSANQNVVGILSLYQQQLFLENITAILNHKGIHSNNNTIEDLKKIPTISKKIDFVQTQHGLNVLDFPVYFYKGFSVFNNKIERNEQHNLITSKSRGSCYFNSTNDIDDYWVCDFDLPDFTEQPSYVEKRLEL